MIKLDMIQIVWSFTVLICDNVIQETIIVFRNKKPLKNLKLGLFGFFKFLV